jgi:hypothetical protein
VNFGFTPPDPEKVLQALEDLKAAFQKAADADTTAQPLFQSLSDTFNKVIDEGMNLSSSDPNPNPGKILRKLMPTMLELKTTLEQIQRAASRDSKVAETMDELGGSIQNAVQGLMGGMPGLGFPGMGFPGGGFPAPGGRPTFDDDEPAAPLPKPKPRPPVIKPKPKKPGAGDFDF